MQHLNTELTCIQADIQNHTNTTKDRRKSKHKFAISSQILVYPMPLSLVVTRTHTLTHSTDMQVWEGRAKGMVCFLMTQTITKLSWQVILRQINASRFNTRRGLRGAGLSNDRSSLASFDRKPIILTALFSQARFLKN